MSAPVVPRGGLAEAGFVVTCRDGLVNKRRPSRDTGRKSSQQLQPIRTSQNTPRENPDERPSCFCDRPKPRKHGSGRLADAEDCLQTRRWYMFTDAESY